MKKENKYWFSMQNKCGAIKSSGEMKESEFKRRIDWLIKWLNADANFEFTMEAWKNTVIPVLLTGLYDGQKEYSSIEEWADDTPIGTTGRTRDEYYEAVKSWFRRMPKTIEDKI